MRTIFILAIVAILLAFAAPPQVKRLNHNYRSTEVEFWYPTFVKFSGNVEFTEKLTIPSSFNSNWIYDQLRSTQFLCAAKKCTHSKNPVFASWVENEASLKRVALEAEGFERELKRAQEESESMKEYLSKNSCVEVETGPQKPPFACADNEAEEIATTTCIIRELGAKACEKIGKDAIDIDAPKFFKDALAREGCGVAAHEITGESYSILDKTVKKYTTDLFVTMISEAIGYFSKGAKDAFDWTVAAAKTQACIPYGVDLCRMKYLNWQQNLNEHFSKFDQQVKYCQQAKERLLNAGKAVETKRGHLASANVLQEQFRKEKLSLEQKVETITYLHAFEAR